VISEQDKQQANARIAELVNIAKQALKEATAIADQHGLEFRWDGPSYGMGGSYQGTRPWMSSTEKCEADNYDSIDEGMWRASSQSC
jgi:hypothetical protein